MDKEVSDDVLGLVEVIGFWAVLLISALKEPAIAIAAAESKIAADPTTPAVEGNVFDMEESDD